MPVFLLTGKTSPCFPRKSRIFGYFCNLICEISHPPAYFAVLMKLSEFKFELPNNLIALEPATNRDESRLMVVHRDTGEIEHRVFKDLVDYFEEGDILVGNDTMVFPARLYGRKEKTGAKIEVFLLRELNPEMHLWDVLVDPA